MGRSYFIVVVCQAVAALAAVAALRWLALYVDPETFGRYALFQSVVSAAGLFLISWPNAALLRFGREEWVRHGSVGATLGARIALFGASVSVAVTLAWLFDSWTRAFLGLSTSPWRWIAFGVMVIPASELAIYTNQAVGRTEIYGYSPVITRVGFLIGVVCIPLLRNGVDWTYLAASFMLSAAAATLFAFGTMPRAAWGGFEIRSPHVLTLVNFSWTLPLAGISTYVVNWVDTWVIRGARGVALVGVYSWAYQATAIAGLAFAPIAVVLTPRVIDARLKNDSARIARYVDAILPAAIGMALATSAGLLVVFPLLRPLIPASYSPAYPIVSVLLSALPAQLISYLVTPLANAYEGLLPRIVVVSLAIAVVNVVADLLLVPRIGIMGAAIATTAAFSIGALLQIAVIQSAGLTFQPLWRYALPSLSLIPVLVLQQTSISALDVSAACFAAGLILVLLWDDLRRLFRGTPAGAIRALVKALTLAETPIGVPLPECDRS